MGVISTIDELEAAMQELTLRGATVNFGLSASPLRRGQWFANTTTSDGQPRQVRGQSLWDALNALLGLHDEVDVITEPQKPAIKKPAIKKPVATNLSDLLE